MSASYPNDIKTFTTKTDNIDDIEASHINDLQNEITAIETELGENPKGTSTNVTEKISGIKCESGVTADSVVVAGNGNITASGSITSGSIVTTGNIYTVPWTNYSDTSTIVGWDSFTTKNIFYKRIGKLVFVQFYLYGTSGSTATSFSLPYQIATGPSIEVVMIGADNGAWTMARTLRLASGATVANFYAGLGNAAWTASGIKAVWGQFWYESV